MSDGLERKERKMANIDKEGRAYGTVMAMQSLLHLLERKGVVSRNEREGMLDAICEEIGDMRKRDVMSPTAAAEASLAVGLMYVPPKT